MGVYIATDISGANERSNVQLIVCQSLPFKNAHNYIWLIRLRKSRGDHEATPLGWSQMKD